MEENIESATLEFLKHLSIYTCMGACVMEILKRSEELYSALTNEDTDEDEMEIKIRLKKEVMFHIAKAVEKVADTQNEAMPDCKVPHGEILEHFMGFLIIQAVRSFCSEPEKAVKDVKLLMEKALSYVKPKTA